MRWHLPIRRHRVAAFILVIIIEALIIVALLMLGVSADRPKKLESELVAFNLAAPKAERSPKPMLPKKAANAAAQKPKQPLPPQPIPTPNMVFMSKDDFAASDISKLPSSAGAASSKSAYGPGEGPGGKTLYPAEWHVEPGRGALAPYLPNGAPAGSWAMVACHTIENYHVDNCYGLGESHRGLASAMRQAAWQFLVRPPRVDGRPLVGAWVRIRFDFSEKPVAE